MTRPVPQKLADLAWMFGVARRAGLIRPIPPRRLLRAGAAARGWGRSLGGVVAANSVLFGDRVHLVDELGQVTFGQLHTRTNAMARGLQQSGVRPGDTVAILCRNHRYFVEATVACAKVGADTVFLNTDFAGPQLRELLAREKPTVVIQDEEFTDRLSGDDDGWRTLLAWAGSDGRSSLEEFVTSCDGDPVRLPNHEAQQVILTSGTTGTPKGARRGPAKSFEVAAAVLDRVPIRVGEVHYIAAPLFHTWGFGNFAFSLVLGSTIVLRRRFDPEDALTVIDQHRPRTVVMVPVMAQRILQIPASTRRKYDLSSLRTVALSGSALPGGFATEFMDAFGDVLYSAYGSTEVGAATFAVPGDLRAAPGTAGAPLRGTAVRVFREDGSEAATGERGRIYVGNSWQVEEFSGGGPLPEVKQGLMATGDMGYFDEEGRLFIDGRTDDMIVSGGENVFPREVEDLLAGHPDISEVAVIGVPDEEYGQRLKAFVVVGPGADLSAVDVREHVRGHLARYKVPRDVVFLEELPRNATGKVLRRVLARTDATSQPA
jgi:acyl-CoA synthetase (AMP-forming)/AMP-acid ligase II